MNTLNQFSYPLIFTGVFLASFIVLRLFLHVRWLVLGAVQVAIIVIFAAGFIIFRPGTSNVSSIAEVVNQIGSGKPALIQFFSNYCTGCMAINPVMQSLEEELPPEFNVLRINIHTDMGRALRQEYGFSFTPEFVLFAPDGVEVWRDHAPPNDTQLDLARSNQTR